VAAQQLESLRNAGAKISLIQKDVARYSELAEALSELDDASTPLRGIFHAAGTFDNGVLSNMDEHRFMRVCHAKLPAVPFCNGL